MPHEIWAVSQYLRLCIVLGWGFFPPIKRTWFHETEMSLIPSSLFTMKTKSHFLGKEEVDGDYFLAQIFQVFSLSLLAPSQGHTCFSYCFQTLMSICFWQSSPFQPKKCPVLYSHLWRRSTHVTQPLLRHCPHLELWLWECQSSYSG